MKPAPFRYAAPESLDAALDLLEDDAEEVRPLAGGQSLVPMLNFRLARPDLLVDLGRLDALAGIRIVGGELRIGAMTRQADLLRSAEAATGWPILRDALVHVGHPATRNRGTVGGSVAHADPAAELPVVLTALDARLHTRTARGARVIAAEDFFLGPLTTALAPGELLEAIELPVPPEGARMAFTEHARTHGDFAIAGAAVVHARATRSAIVLLGADLVPVRAAAAERALQAGAPAAEVAALAGEQARDPYRRALLTALVERALAAVGA